MRHTAAACLMFFLSSTLISPFTAACTGTTVKAVNGDIVFCRTMEWDNTFMPTELVATPRNHVFTAQMPEGMKGMTWTGKYGIAGLFIIPVQAYADGMNEMGLTVGGFYHEFFAEYAEYSSAQSERTISPVDVIPYLLSTCATVDDVRAALERVVVVAVEMPEFGAAVEFHFMVTEPSGKQVIVEYSGGKPKFFDSPVGVIANSPTYDWHLLNLGNFIRLPSPEIQERKMGDYTIHALDTGTDLLGLPGDFASPSRFVRAAILTHYVRRTADAKEAVYQAFQIMDSFNTPVYRGGPDNNETDKARSETSWTLAHDLANRAFYYHTANDRTVQKVDLTRIDFQALAAPVHLAIDKGEMTVIDRTADLMK